MPRIGHRPMYGFMPMLGAKQITYTANATRFEQATPDGLEIAYNPSDSKKLTFSMWFKRASDTGVVYMLMNGQGGGLAERIQVTIESADTLKFVIMDASATRIRTNDFITSNTITTGTWHHLYFAIDSDAAVEAMDVYLDGAAVSWGTAPGAWVNNALGLARTEWHYGIYKDGVQNPFDGCFADLWFSAGNYLPASNYLSYFRNPMTGKPKQLATNGVVGGVAPDWWLTNPAASFEIDRSDNGNDWTPIGSLSACSDSPSD